VMVGPGLAGWKMAMDFKGSHFEREIVLWDVRWYVAYPISYRQLEEMVGERGVEVDHSTLNRWILKYVPLLEKVFATHKRPVGNSWRLDETSYEGHHVKHDFYFGAVFIDHSSSCCCL
jgi:transposase-like protein